MAFDTRPSSLETQVSEESSEVPGTNRPFNSLPIDELIFDRDLLVERDKPSNILAVGGKLIIHSFDLN